MAALARLERAVYVYSTVAVSDYRRGVAAHSGSPRRHSALVVFCSPCSTACAASNACFAARGVLTKLIRARHAADNYSLFLHINVIGALMAGGYVVASGAPIILPDSTPILVVNGVAFWAYLQLSWLVLARVTAVTHSVCNAMRRPVVILAGWLQFGNEITSLNACGIALACGGAALYGHLSRPPPPPPPDRDDEARETLV